MYFEAISGVASGSGARLRYDNVFAIFHHQSEKEIPQDFSSYLISSTQKKLIDDNLEGTSNSSTMHVANRVSHCHSSLISQMYLY